MSIVSGDRVVFSKGYGVASVETREPVRPEMLFRLGSTTKMFTAAALVLLAEKGAVDLNAPIGNYVKDLQPKIAQLTAHQLLTHTSGFLDEAPMFGSDDESALEKEVRSWTANRFFTEPGRIYSYSNPAFWLAGFVVESVSGKRYADELTASLFKPLGMSRTTLRPLVAMTYPIAQGHDDWPKGPAVIRPAANNAASWPAGSIFSSVEDLSRFVIAFVNGGRIGGDQVLPRDADRQTESRERADSRQRRSVRLRPASGEVAWHRSRQPRRFTERLRFAHPHGAARAVWRRHRGQSIRRHPQPHRGQGDGTAAAAPAGRARNRFGAEGDDQRGDGRSGRNLFTIDANDVNRAA